jgi:hypothetical protein
MLRSRWSFSLCLVLGAWIQTANAQTRHRNRPSPARLTPVTTPTPSPAPATQVEGPHDVRYALNVTQGTWGARCVATRGCTTPRSYPRCQRPAPNVRVATRYMFTDAFARRLSLADQQVSVRGRLLGTGAMTVMACAQGVCCNSYGGSIVLTGVGANSRDSIALAASRDDAAWACVGDDSGLCCVAAVPATEVLVSGTLRLTPNSDNSWRIENPNVCLMELRSLNLQ